ncbi:MAG: hypothetical protein ACE5D2_07645 [Fidelibacterota bacterium]
MKRPLIDINPHYFYYRDSFWNANKEKYYQVVWLGAGLPVTLHYPSNDGNAKEMVEAIEDVENPEAFLAV